VSQINEPTIIWILVGLSLLYFGWKWYRYGSFTGATLGARIARTVGEITLSSSTIASVVLKINILETNPGTSPQIALVLISKALPFAASMTPIKLSQVQAKHLADLLQKATGA
jgi:hypothetical protein